MRNSYRDWMKTKLFDNGLNITFTFKQIVDGIKIDKISAERNFRYFRNMLNKKIFGNSYKRFGKQLKMLVIREVSNTQRLHLHTIIEKPKNIILERFIYFVRLCWSKTLFGYTEVDIQQPSNQYRVEGWFKYIMKRNQKIDFSDSIDLENSTALYC